MPRGKQQRRAGGALRHQLTPHSVFSRDVLLRLLEVSPVLQLHGLFRKELDGVPPQRLFALQSR